MYPDQQPPQQQPYSIDYLNQISAPQPVRRGFNHIQLVILGVLMVATLVVIGLSIALNTGSSPDKLSYQLVQRIDNTNDVVESYQKTVKNSSLRALNSSLRIYLTNTVNDLKEPLAVNGINSEKVPKAIAALEKKSIEELSTRLEEGRLFGTFDRAYAREMSYQLETIVGLMREIYNSSTSKSLKESLDEAYKSLEPIQKEFAAFNEGAS